MQNITSYRELHEQFMYNHKGTTIWECLFLVIPAPILIYFVSRFIITSYIPRLTLVAFLLEYTFYIVPVISLYTIFSDYTHVFFCISVLMYVVSMIQILGRRNRNFLPIIFSMVLPPQKRPFITYFRSVCFTLTALCILAVDFKCFPRRFAKTETYGYSIMDTGVGFFIISNALVTKLNIHEHFVTSVKSSLPIFVLGVLRCLSLKSLDYHHHVSEYGVHWNFFFTLTVLKLSSPVVLSFFPRSAGIVSLITAVLHQAALSCGLEAWAIGDTPRDGFLAANREGLVSLPGYASLYFAGVSIGKLLYSENVDIQNDVIRSLRIFVASAVFFLMTLLLQPRIGVSRRVINLTYITWLIAFSLLVLGICLIIEISVRIFYYIDGVTKDNNIVPILTDAVNYNSLFFFIIANLFTGFVNLTIKTLYADTLTSFLLVAMHMLFICYVVSFMYRYNIRIKL